MSRPRAILCIDDNVLGLSIRKAMLESRDFRVFTAESGSAGLEIVNRERVDVVILDYKMPGMDGGTVAKELRRKYPEVRILLFSGFAGQIPNWLLQLVDGFVAKGASPVTLIQELERILAEKQKPAAPVTRISEVALKRPTQSRQRVRTSKQHLRRCRQTRNR